MWSALACDREKGACTYRLGRNLTVRAIRGALLKLLDDTIVIIYGVCKVRIFEGQIQRVLTGTENGKDFLLQTSCNESAGLPTVSWSQFGTG